MPERDALDRILSSEDALAPSSGFAARVMDVVDAAASEPPPLPFPWGRFSLAVIATVASVASGAWLIPAMDLSPVVAAVNGSGRELGYAAATILATLAMLYAPRLRAMVRRLLPQADLPRTTPRA